jgi:phospho-N-acetylmuramoyl-pentapeptide-transferase
MGGFIILLSILIPVLLLGDLTNIYVLLLILTTVWLGAIGFLDDYIKVFKRKKEGLSGRYKIFGQVSLGLIVGLTLCFSDQATIRDKAESTLTHQEQNLLAEKELASYESSPARAASLDSHYNPAHKSTKTTIPFVKSNEFDYAWLAPGKGTVKNILQWIIYIFVIILVITATSNGTNLTDGLDGLAAGTSAIAGVALGILAYLSGNIIYADYLNIMYIPNSGEITVFMAAYLGALLGFIWYNVFPAQVFMGDTGSLTLGGILAVVAIIVRKELLLPILCGIFFVESLSVILQTTYYKYTRARYGEPRRIFRMSPLHHHFQKQGIPALLQRPAQPMHEVKITMRFWIIGIVLAVLTIVSLKIR